MRCAHTAMVMRGLRDAKRARAANPDSHRGEGREGAKDPPIRVLASNGRRLNVRIRQAATPVAAIAPNRPKQSKSLVANDASAVAVVVVVTTHGGPTERQAARMLCEGAASCSDARDNKWTASQTPTIRISGAKT